LGGLLVAVAEVGGLVRCVLRRGGVRLDELGGGRSFSVIGGGVSWKSKVLPLFALVTEMPPCTPVNFMKSNSGASHTSTRWNSTVAARPMAME